MNIDGMNELEARLYQFSTKNLPAGASYLINDLWQRVQDLERQNALLRAVAEAAHDFVEDTYYTYSVELKESYQEVRKAAIDGGALEDSE